MKPDVLLDTNILMYSVDEDSVFNQRALAFLRRTDLTFVTTAKNFSEFLASSTKGELPRLTAQEAVETLDFFRQRYRVLFPTPTSFLELEALVTKYNIKGFRIHDAEIAAIGLANGVSTIATFNTDDFKNIGEITLLTP
jgi:predicted nucleic acid-binding protein